jgi:hypothetical protein
VSAPHPGHLLNDLIHRAADQAPIGQASTSFPHLQLARTAEGVQVVEQGRIVHAQTHECLTNGRFGKAKVIDRDTFALVCADAEYAKTFRDEEIADAALAFFVGYAVSDITAVNRCLSLALAANHGCPTIDLKRLDSFVVLPPRGQG